MTHCVILHNGSQKQSHKLNSTMRTMANVLQHNRLDAKSFVSIELRRQTKTTASIFL